MLDLALSLYLALSFCIVGLVGPFAIYLCRRTGLCAALWLAFFLVARFALGLLQPALSNMWSSALVQGWQHGRDTSWHLDSPAQLMMVLSYATSVPLHIAALLVCALLMGDVLRLLESQGVEMSTKPLKGLLVLSQHHVLCGIGISVLLLLSPLSHVLIAHFIVPLFSDPIGELSLALSRV